MALENLFKFERPEEVKQRQLDFERKIFPLGLEQKNAVLNALRPLINPRIHDTNLLYVFISAKQKYIENVENGLKYTQKCINGHGFISATEKKYILALVLLDTEAKSLEEYPTMDDIKLKAATL